MTLIVETPDSRAPERDYILSVVLDQFLGLAWKRVPSDRIDTRITLQGHQGEIRMPDVLLQTPDEDWLTIKSLPEQPLSVWDSREMGLDITLVDQHLPIVYGDHQFLKTNNSLSSSGPGPSALGSASSPLNTSNLTLKTYIPLDVFGSAFFMLTRYEEMVKPDRDEHDRFPAWASLAFQEGFLERPIVDEYVEILWAAIRALWTGLERVKQEPRIQVTCDVDSPFCFDGSVRRMVRRVGGDLLKRRSPITAARRIIGSWLARKGDHHLDPHRNGLSHIMDVNEQAGRSVAFYFITEKTHPRLDKPVSLDDPRMRQLLREIHARGHEIGLHPGYNTYRHPEAMARSAETLRRVMAKEGIEQEQVGGRQHFLRWETPTTPSLGDQSGLDYDSTLSYADHPGFRCGTCREYPFYDLEQRRMLRIRERPLIVMECSVIAGRYMGLGYGDDALALMEYYRDTCHHLGGNFTLLWHNSHLKTSADRRFYRRLAG